MTNIRTMEKDLALIKQSKFVAQTKMPLPPAPPEKPEPIVLEKPTPAPTAPSGPTEIPPPAAPGSAAKPPIQPPQPAAPDELEAALLKKARSSQQARSFDPYKEPIEE